MISRKKIMELKKKKRRSNFTNRLFSKMEKKYCAHSKRSNADRHRSTKIF